MIEYDKRFKDLLSQIPYIIEDKFVIQWFIVGFLHKIRAPLRMHEITIYEKALRKA